MPRLLTAVLLVVMLGACEAGPAARDAGGLDGGALDASAVDGSAVDASAADAGARREPVEALCADVAASICHALFSCGCNPELRSYADEADCVSQRAAACLAAVPTSVRSRIDAGTLVFDEGTLAGCLDAVRALSDECQFGAPPACDLLFADPAAVGGTCASGTQNAPCAGGVGLCGSDLRCVALPGKGEPCALGRCAYGARCVGERCLAIGEAGASCASGEPCAEGLVCLAGACAARVEAAGACESTEVCAAGLRCDASACTAPEPGERLCSYPAQCGALEACVRNPGARTCTTGLAVGEACSTDEPCAPGLRCGADARCFALPDVGESCADLYECVPGVSCVDGMCLRNVPLGEPCAWGLGADCEEGLGCDVVRGVCSNGGAAGEPCHRTRFGPGVCQPGLGCDFTPDGDVCRAISARGGPCTNDSLCGPEDFCDYRMSRCDARRPEDAPCSAGNECARGLSCQPGEGRIACRPVPALGEPCIFECRDGALCSGVGGLCAPMVCAVP